ncbi:hypothetical protein V495_06570 [Pseudogymnoascus sp. VKM F-4514 (FW-929)]|nr:hypothetical protein V495_06570 [Pseudogymnoascus sp. VKM F-4514 (FW-929)]KFY65717.1 hypothetical protein V497_01308 [Pseudogymnoascus sp. VKM F-4516 (FW-969)]
MADLAQLLDQIRREDGSVDVTRRKLELEGLFRSLLPNEIRLAKDILSATTFVSDIIPRLPIDILLLVVDYIEDLVDFKTMRTVSKTWQRIWTLGPVCDKLMKRHFRPFFKGAYQHLSDDEKTSASITLSEQLRAMGGGQYHSMKIYKYSDLGGFGEPSPLHFSSRQYRNGRVAWSIGSVIHVYSLRTGVAKSYMTPDRADINKWSLYDDMLVIIENGRIPRLYAYYLCRTHDDSDRTRSVAIPSPVSQVVAAQCHRIGAVTEDGEIFLWDMASGRVKQIDYTVDPIPRHRGERSVKIILPPGPQDTLYICTMATTKHGQGTDSVSAVTLVMQKYSKGKLIQNKRIAFPPQGLAGSVFTLNTPMREIDDDGTFNVCQLPVDYPSTWTDLGCNHRWHRHKRPGEGLRQLIMQIAYNVCDDQFSKKYYHLPSGQKHLDDVNFTTPRSPFGSYHMPSRYHFWASNLYLPVIAMKNSPALAHDCPSRFPVNNGLILAIKSCDQIRGTPSDVKFMGGYGPESWRKKLWTSKERYPTFDLGVSHILVGPIELAHEREKLRVMSTDHLREASGDGSFLILFGQHDFVAWSFNKSQEYGYELSPVLAKVVQSNRAHYKQMQTKDEDDELL